MAYLLYTVICFHLCAESEGFSTLSKAKRLKTYLLRGLHIKSVALFLSIYNK